MCECHLQIFEHCFRMMSNDATCQSHLTLRPTADNSSVSLRNLKQQSSSTAGVAQCWGSLASSALPAHTRRQQIYVRSHLFRSYERSHWTLSFWHGSARILQCWEDRGRENTCQTVKGGHGVAVTLSNRFVLPFRFEIISFWDTAAHYPQMSLSSQWNIALPPIIEYDNFIVQLVTMGDIDGMKAAFSMKKATPFDTLVDGTTLLHVCISQS